MLEEVDRFKDRPELTKLKTNMAGVDPDEIYSRVPYEKGFHFLRRLESQVGRPAFDAFLKKYIAKFRFQSITTEAFLEFLKEELPNIEKEVDLDNWIYGTGVPSDAIKPKNSMLDLILNLALGFPSGQRLSKEETEKWGPQVWQVYLENLPKKMEPEEINQLNNTFRFSESKNWEIKVAFLVIAATSGHAASFPTIEAALHAVGRMKYLRPIYAGLLESTPDAKDLAKRVFSEARSKYHPIAQSVIQGLLKKSAL